MFRRLRSRRSLRLRLAFISTAIVAVVLAGFGAGVFLFLRRALYTNLDATLARQAREIGRVTSIGDADIPPYVFGGNRPDIFIQVVDQQGRVVQRSELLGQTELPVGRRVIEVARGKREAYYTDFEVSGVHLRARVGPILDTLDNARFAGVVASLSENITDPLRRLGSLLVWVGGLGILLAGWLSWNAARAALRPVDEVAAAANEIRETGDLSRRVAPANEAELARLTSAFNAMLDRLESAQASLEKTLEGQRRFLADASHELRTPLTTMRGNLEVILRDRSVSLEDRADALRDSLDEAERMSVLVEDLLTLGRSDAGAPLPEEPVNLTEVVREAIASASEVDVVEGGDGPFVRLGTFDDLVVNGSGDRIRRLIGNLVDNAIKYTPASGTIDVSIEGADSFAVVTVADTGIGMTEEELAHAFDRFWRSDSSRGERGSGLGLAIAKSVAEEHGGSVEAISEQGRGTTMIVRLPLRAVDPAPRRGLRRRKSPSPR
jgi:two-component system, OmpR family, sensor kinase